MGLAHSIRNAAMTPRAHHWEPRTGPTPTSRVAHILIVDDDEMARTFCRTVLGGAGHELLFAPDGEVALRIFQTQDVDVVITDLAMPNLNGLRLIQELLDHDPAARIIAVSGESPEQLDTAERFGAIRTMFKPLRPPELLRAVTEALESTGAEAPPPDDPWW